MKEIIDYREDEGKNGMFSLTIEKQKVSGYETSIGYVFSDKKLVAGGYDMDGINEESFSNLSKKFTEKYGEPYITKDSTGWGKLAVWVDSAHNAICLSEILDVLYIKNDSPYLDFVNDHFIEFHDVDLISSLSQEGLSSESAPSTSETSTPSQEKVSPVDSQSETSSINESILSICPNASISEKEGDLSIDLSECYDSASDEYIRNLLHDCARIIGTSNFADKCSGLSFSYVDKNFVSILTVTSFNDISDYYTSLFCTKTENGDDNYYAAYTILYKKLFYNHDISSRQLIEQGKIADKYGVNGGDATADPEPEDDLWFYSSFSDSLIHKLSESTYFINYRYSEKDLFAYGKSVGKDISVASDNLTVYLNNAPDLISFNKFLIICFDGNSDTRYFEYQLEKTKENSWNVTIYNSFNDDFKAGLENGLNN